MDRLAALTAFAAVAEAGSFAAAARRLGRSTSRLSRQVAELEAALGSRLLHRTTRALTLTEAGRSYHEQVARILAELDAADLSVGRLQAAPRGRLRVAAPMSFGVLHLAPALPAFLDRYPEIDLDMAMNDRFVDLVEEGFDLAVRIGRLADSSLVARRLAPLRRVLCASPAFLAAHGTPRTPDDLARLPCLGYSNLLPQEDWSFADPVSGRPWPVRIKARLRVNNGDALRLAALAGVGLAPLPSFLVGPDLAAGTLVPLLDPYLRQEGAIHAVYPPARPLLPKVRAFVDFLAERFGPRPYWEPPSFES
jgi:DNA-binding transcriptional LysR family regulator